MFRSVCPTCTESSSFDDARAGREVECPRCRTPFVAEPERGRGDPDDRRDRAPQKDGSGYATLSVVLGLIAMPSAFCCVGAIFGVGGLLCGYAGLQSKLRTVSIFGMILNTAAIAFSIGMIVFYLVTQSAIDREVPPAPDGTQAPFVNNAKK